jgi:hypothetical protein
MAETKPLTDDERTELDALRAEKENPKVEEKPEDEPLPDTHWLNLADGTTVVSKGTGTHFNGIPVLHATPIPEELQEGGKVNSEPAHRF